ncbi:MAG: hypothetical protein VX084_05650, partial [Planctomycetota bacterium]|nr:hypothetical protein [Planctomycetota bacterium]
EKELSNQRANLIAVGRKVITKSDMKVLSDPALVLLKSRLREALRTKLGEEIHDVVFAEYSIVSN